MVTEIGGNKRLLPRLTPYYDSIWLLPRESEEVPDKFASTILLLGALLLTGCAAPKATPELTGVANFRDVGGYKTEDGHSIRRGLLYRSAQLSEMTPSDREKLLNLGIRYEIDLRTAHERTGQPSHWEGPTPKILIAFRYPEDEQKPQDGAPAGSSMNIKQATAMVMSPNVTVSQVREFMNNGTVRIMIDHAADIGGVMRDLAQEDAPALLHCTGGKDRTGVTVAVLMTLLGVPREEIYKEYLHSNDQLELWYRQTKENKQAAGQPYTVSFELFRTRSGVDRSWLENAFQTIDRQYHSFDRYTQDALKLNATEINQLRARFLAN